MSIVHGTAGVTPVVGLTVTVGQAPIGVSASGYGVPESWRAWMPQWPTTAS